ncbi:MAG: serine--tRNA ligase [Thermoanaerobaculia bacterium]|nr:serine--tRNA ligase [Thermoanaerobaculia bacterium]
MLSIESIRTQREAVAEALRKRMEEAEVTRQLDEIAELDVRRRSLIQEVEEARAERKRRSREYGEAIRAGRAVERPTDLPDPAEAEGRLREVEERLNDLLRELPNLPAEDVVAGGKEANRVLRSWGEPPELAEPIPHWEVAERLGLVDFERGVELGGSGFWIYTGAGAQLEWALLNFFIAENLRAGYTMLLPPHLVLPAAGVAAGQFPKFTEDVYHTTEPRGLFLIPTSETAIAGAYADEIFEADDLPAKLFAFTPCYRREKAGPHSDERGTVRGHQFNKVEIFQFVEAGDAAAALEEMVTHVEAMVAKLELHHRTSLLAAGDASAAMRKTLDVEVWLPSVGGYKEVSSVSWAGDYQARRAAIRYRPREGKGTRFVHTLNGSALATSRVFPAVLEQHQRPDGSVRVPEALWPYSFGLREIGP